MRKREILKLLDEVLTGARMDRADFYQLSTAQPYPISEQEVTEFIKKRTELYRESWIVAPLKRAIALIEQDGKKSDQ